MVSGTNVLDALKGKGEITLVDLAKKLLNEHRSDSGENTLANAPGEEFDGGECEENGEEWEEEWEWKGCRLKDLQILSEVD